MAVAGNMTVSRETAIGNAVSGAQTGVRRGRAEDAQTAGLATGRGSGFGGGRCACVARSVALPIAPDRDERQGDKRTG